jgi:hypothetical protein
LLKNKKISGMKKAVGVLSLIFLAVAFSGCSRYYYSPNAVNVPLLSHAGQVRLNAGTGTDGHAATKDFQFSFSPLEHLGVMGGYSSWSYDNGGGTSANAKARLFEIGAGYYGLVDNSGYFIYDIYSGAGSGSLQSDVNMNVFKWFVQPGLGVRLKVFEGSINWRLSNIRYSGLNTNGHDLYYLREHHLVDPSGRSIENRNYFFSEPAITFRVGYKCAKFELQFVSANALSYVPWIYNDGLIRIGLSFLINGYKNSPGFRKTKKTGAAE